MVCQNRAETCKTRGRKDPTHDLFDLLFFPVPHFSFYFWTPAFKYYEFISRSVTDEFSPLFQRGCKLQLVTENSKSFSYNIKNCPQ